MEAHPRTIRAQEQPSNAQASTKKIQLRPMKKPQTSVLNANEAGHFHELYNNYKNIL